MPGRSFTANSKYRYGFNGKENDPETVGTGEGLQDYGMRIYNPALGKFLSVDPLVKEYPWYTPYQFAGNKPIEAIDLDGAEEYHYTLVMDKLGKPHLICTSIDMYDDVWPMYPSINVKRYHVFYNGENYYIGYSGPRGRGNDDPRSIKVFENLLKHPKALTEFDQIFYSESWSYKMEGGVIAYNYYPNQILVGRAVLRSQIRNLYGFEKIGYKYTNEVIIRPDGSVDFTHYIVKGDRKVFCGYSDINSKGVLTNSFQVPDEFKNLGVSKAIYERMLNPSINIVQSKLMEDNFAAFQKNYDPNKGNLIEALLNTPGGKVLTSHGYVPDPNSVKVGTNYVDVQWTRGGTTSSGAN